MPRQLYPRTTRTPRNTSGRRWRIDYDLTYDFCGSGPFTVYYRSEFSARVCCWWRVHISSWGGSAVLIDQHKELIALPSKKDPNLLKGV